MLLQLVVAQTASVVEDWAMHSLGTRVIWTCEAMPAIGVQSKLIPNLRVLCLFLFQSVA